MCHSLSLFRICSLISWHPPNLSWAPKRWWRTGAIKNIKLSNSGGAKTSLTCNRQWKVCITSSCLFRFGWFLTDPQYRETSTKCVASTWFSPLAFEFLKFTTALGGLCGHKNWHNGRQRFEQFSTAGPLNKAKPGHIENYPKSHVLYHNLWIPN